MRYLKLNQGTLDTEIVYSDDYANDSDCFKDIVGEWICEATGYFDLPEEIVAYVNDEGLLKPEFEPTVITAFPARNGAVENVPLVGNVVFCRVNDEGEEIELTDKNIEDIRKVLNSYPKIVTNWKGKNVNCLYNHYFCYD